MSRRINYKNILLIIGIPVLYAFFLMLIFGFDDWESIFGVMSITFLFCLPAIVGGITVYLSSEHLAQKISYKLLMPWVPIFVFFILTILFSLEGWACWIMILPMFLVASSIGGVIGGWLKTRKGKNRINFSLLMFLPFIFGPLENLMGTIPGTYKAYTYIDINASGEKIWGNVTRVSEIDETHDKGLLTKFLGFPRPVKAELNYEGVGAYREAIFTNGLVFHETVLEYTHLKKMVFTIKADPYEIPSATLDEHVVIGGKFFDVLTGTYELEKLGPEKYRLHLYSFFTLKTNFNFYASWWAGWIMKDIQNNILQVEKIRSEKV
jgi:hypothetical protein